MPPYDPSQLQSMPSPPGQWIPVGLFVAAVLGVLWEYLIRIPRERSQ